MISVSVNHLPRQKTTSLTAALTLILGAFSLSINGHEGHGDGGGSTASAGASPVGSAADGFGGALADLTDDDTVRYSANFFGFISNSWSPNGHEGEPLGTGGKLPVVYNEGLYVETTPDQATLFRRDLRAQYGDFGYLPLWRNNVLFGRIAYRLRDDIKAAVSLSYGGETGQPGTNLTNGMVSITEATLAWMPTFAEGFSLKAGNLANVGSYCDIYNQAPLENYVITGLDATYSRKFTDASSYSFGAVGGATFQNSSTKGAVSSARSGFSYFQSSRQRSYLYAKGAIAFDGRYSLSGIAGYQSVPSDANRDFVGAETWTYRRTQGWHAGLSAGYFGKYLRQNAAVTYGSGDVLMGWGSPDYVRVVEKDETAGTVTERFSKQGSTLVNGIYWGSLDFSRFHLGLGAWVSHHQPNPSPIRELNNNFTSDSAVLAQFDSLGMAAPAESVTLRAQRYTTAKVTLAPGLRIAGPLYCGVRFDHIRYFDPEAHTNGQEIILDQSLNPSESIYPYGYRQDLSGPSKWELEAVNVSIISPFVALEFPKIGGISAMYSYGLYGESVRRQGTIADRHSNYTLNAYVNYTIKKRIAKPQTAAHRASSFEFGSLTLPDPQMGS